jgi:hypothetical protein
MNIKENSVLKIQWPNTCVIGQDKTCTLWYTVDGKILGISEAAPTTHDEAKFIKLYFDEKGACPETVDKNQELSFALKKVFKTLRKFRETEK